MYKLSTRQLLLIALLSALFAAGAIASLDRLSKYYSNRTAAFTEGPPPGITDPSVATNEQNNIEVYKAISPGVVNVTSTAYQEDFFGQIEEGQGSGSGSIIDDQGDILTNYHVIADAQKLSVSLGGQKQYP